MDAPTIIGIICTIIIGLIGYDIRSIRKETKKHIDETNAKIAVLVESQHDCQRHLSEKYASRPETRDKFKDLFTRTDDHERRLAYAEGRQNGGH